ncbi:Hypothetical predicted protein [Mytilus galloprovincialis]|uniref:C-type lectin domain-containing protein n=1 Tax=Mytilus galloprovincialis TaxID=29158 RepID=A0A8B6FDI5_MYTGA|nr:Hypothetical predicted protein [Mytilus galloprovincialis]
MKTRYIHDITAISLLLSFCSCEQEYNITFHEDKTTWIDAVKHCYDNDGVLYNNKDDIKKRLTNISIDSEVWAGQYKILSPWTVTWGCHKIQDITTKTKFKVPRINQTECQSLCSGTEYFAVKDDTCVCLLLGDLKDKLSYNSCSCDECYRVIRHNKTNVAMSCKDETKCLCIYAACTGKVLSLTPGNCGLPFIVECDGVTNTKPVYRNHADAVRFCNDKSTILQWYTHGSCSLPMGTAQHWTSGTRIILNTYQVKLQELPNLLPSFRCLKLTKQTDTEEYGACDKENVILPFFCKIDNKQTNKVISENNNTGVLAGSVTLVLVVVAISILGMFLYKRRLDSKASESKSQNIDQTTNQLTTEINSDGPKTGLRKGNRPLPIPFIHVGNMSYDKPEEDENTYCRIASVCVEEPINNFSNLCYDEIIFKGDTNSSEIHHKENTLPVDNTENDENVYSRIVSAVFDE